MSLLRVGAALVDGQLRDDVTIEVAGDGCIEQVRPGRRSDGPMMAGVLVPGLVNAHTHLELSAVGLVPGGGFVPWLDGLVQRIFEIDDAAREDAGRRAAVTLHDLGHALVGDISNRGDTAPWLLEAGLSGIVHHEILGFGREQLAGALERVASIGEVHREARQVVHVRPSPHAPTSTAPSVMSAALRAPGHEVPGSIHLAETAEERQFLDSGTGPFGRLLDERGRDWRWWEAPGVSPVQYMQALGLAGEGVLAVHAVEVDAVDIQTLVTTGMPVCLCPRSNLHISGRLPDVPAMVRAGVGLCIGTDSLASSPDLDVVEEIRLLSERFSEVPPETWWSAATEGGARAMGFSGLGRLAEGTRPGLLWFEGASSLHEALSAPRRWLIRPSVA